MAISQSQSQLSVHLFLHIKMLFSLYMQLGLNLALLIIIGQIMNRVSQYRDAWRKARRHEELTAFKQNVRNLIYYHLPHESAPGHCPLCLDDRWVYAEDLRHVVKLVIAIFHERHVCSGHIEVLISKTLECLQIDPTIYKRLMNEGMQRREIVYRKIVLLLEIFDGQLLLGQEAIWEEILQSFKEKGEFIIKLMDCAYSFNEWSVDDEYDENWDSEVKSICYTSVLNMFGKHPQLFSSYLEEYPINILLQKSKARKRVELLSLLSIIVCCSQQKAESQFTVYCLFKGFKNHLEDIKMLQQSLEVFIGQIELFKAFSGGTCFVDTECIALIICFIRTNLFLKEYVYKIVLEILTQVRDRYFHKLDHQLISQIDSLLITMMNTAREEMENKEGTQMDEEL